MPETRAVPHQKIPGQSRLFLEYLDRLPGARRFYQRPPTIGALEQFARESLSRFSHARAGLAEILERQNKSLGAGEATFKHIRELEFPDCVAVLTGQQVGIFTGPLYTIYKALTAIRLAEELSARNIRAVPVFWMECEDHDLQEITHATVVGGDQKVRRLDFLERLFGPSRDSAKPVGSLRLPEAIRDVVREYCGHLRGGPHHAEIVDMLESAYRPEAGLADAFGQLMTRLFGGRGLIFFNPGDRYAKHLAAPIFRRALRNAEEIRNMLIERNVALVEAGFHAQVSLFEDSTVLFLREGEERRALTTDGAHFIPKNSDCAYSLEDLLALSETAPERFSPNVLLRPLVQDFLFPTAAYIGGPGEIAYFAQNEVLYRMFDRPMPVIWPRHGFTLIEPEVQSAMDKSLIAFEDCLQGRQAVIEKIMESGKESAASAKLKRLGEELAGALREIRPEMVFAEASLGPALDMASKKIQHNIQSLHSRLLEIEARQDNAVAGNADLILSHCYPGGHLQERELGMPVFLAQHGLRLLDTIYAEVRVELFEHRVITL